MYAHDVTTDTAAPACADRPHSMADVHIINGGGNGGDDRCGAFYAACHPHLNEGGHVLLSVATHAHTNTSPQPTTTSIEAPGSI